MGAMAEPSTIAAILFGKTRRAVLSLLFSHVDESFYLRQIVRLVGTGMGTVQRELRVLTDAGIIRRAARGRRVYYQANPDYSLSSQIRALVTTVAPSHAKASTIGTKTNVENIIAPRDKIRDFCKRHRIKRLSLFGSVLRNDFGPDSDVDVLVEFEPGHVPGLFALYDMESELSSLFGSRKVDLRTPQELSRYFRANVVKESVVQYEAT
jgi:predicted nucleotidyltransferase